jgi:crotonobetainyl-CoA:carnitine CoA-transferase CaiB-like acyl-CoA transferase
MQTVHDHTSAETAHTPPVRQASGPLAGMRVLELAQIMAGPTCGMLLADMGADVIKIEKLPGGDDSRNYREPRIRGVSAPYLVTVTNVAWHLISSQTLEKLCCCAWLKVLMC